MYMHVRVEALVCILTTCKLPPPSLCHRSCQAGSWKNTPLDLSFRAKRLVRTG